MNRAVWGRVLGAGLAAVTLAAAPGCGARDYGPPVLKAADVERRTPAADAPVDAVSRGLAALGHELARTDAAPGKNWIASPLSIGSAFAMARAGANGETAAEIDRVLGLPAAGGHDAYNAVTRQVVTGDGPPPAPVAKREPGPPRPPTVRVGNALFTQHGLPIGPRFLDTLAAQYGAGVRPVDFASPDAADMINSWVRRETAGRIGKLFDELPGDTKLVLANTVYLRADWARPFTESRPDTFRRAGGSTVEVPMMHQEEKLGYAAGDGWQAVEVPYAGGRFAMRILLPSGDRAPATLLAPDAIAAVTAALRPMDVELSLPRWDFTTTIDLTRAMRNLGVTRAFDATADFSGISPGLYIDRAIHRATITVDEWGTEAAAVSGIGMALSAGPQPQVQVRVDRPFAFAIIHGPTRVPLFVGQVADPSARD
jgi:serpin B